MSPFASKMRVNLLVDALLASKMQLLVRSRSKKMMEKMKMNMKMNMNEDEDNDDNSVCRALLSSC